MKLTNWMKMLFASMAVTGVLAVFPPTRTMLRVELERVMAWARDNKSLEQMETEIRIAMRDLDAEFPRHASRLAELESDLEKTRRVLGDLGRAAQEERLNLAGDRELLQRDGDRFEVGKGRGYSRVEIEADARARLSTVAMLEGRMEAEQKSLDTLSQALEGGRANLAKARARRQEMENQLTVLMTKGKSAEGQMRLLDMTRELRSFDAPADATAEAFAQLERRVRDMERRASERPQTTGGVVDWAAVRVSDAGLLAQIDTMLEAQHRVGKAESK